MHWVQHSCLAILAAYAGTSIRVLVALLLIESPTNVLGKAMEDDLNTWAPVTLVKEQDGIPGSCLQPGPELLQPFKQLSQQMEDQYFSLCLSLSLHLSLSLLQKINPFKKKEVMSKRKSEY